MTPCEISQRPNLWKAIRGIIVEANTRHEHSGTDGELRFCEFSENKLCRQFGLPSEIDVNKVSASLR